MLTVAEYELSIHIQKQKEGGYVGHCLSWDDCYAQGKTIEEVMSEISHVATSLIELYRKEQMKIPLTMKKRAGRSADDFTFKFPLIVSV